MKKRTSNIERRTFNVECGAAYYFALRATKHKSRSISVDRRRRGDYKKGRGKEAKSLRLPAVAPFDSTHGKQGKPVRQAQGKRIELSWGKWAIVDAEDYEMLKRYKWLALEKGRSLYAKTYHLNGKSLHMHRLIMNAPSGLVVDHINHNGLDNRKSNLRLCTRLENQRNARPSRGGSSKYKGVCWHKASKQFAVQISFEGKRLWLGYFKDETDAAKAYDKKARELFGEFAYLNFPEDSS
ncbi:MAG: HNH endonuclease [Planctomycetota bacterium]